MIVTLDGPTGSGKTTAAAIVSKNLGICHLKGGIFLRPLTLYCLENNLVGEMEISNAATSITLNVLNATLGSQDIQLELNGVLLMNKELWNEQIDSFVSHVASFRGVREARKIWLRNMVGGIDVVADGRTLGSEVFPDAEHKFVITCDITERARRRSMQKNYSDSLERVLGQIKERDLRDSIGEFDRTIYSDSAINIDSTNLTAHQVAACICEKIRDSA